MIAGVDGMRGGWVIALLDGAALRWATAPDAAGVLERTAGAELVGVDIPMGLPHAGNRDCDLRARELLGRARSSVFPAPPRAVLGATDYRNACALARAADGRAISKQAWNILPRIADWDGALTPGLQQRVAEVHPELSFRALAPETPFERKKSARGLGARVAALAAHVDLRGLAELPRGPAFDDALDAVAAALSARRFAAGTARVLGGERDARGLAMRIVY